MTQELNLAEKRLIVLELGRIAHRVFAPPIVGWRGAESTWVDQVTY
jgi:hypothetical protein